MKTTTQRAGRALGQLTGEQHQDGGAGDVAGSAAPAAHDARPEGHEVKEEGYDEERDHGPSHIWWHQTSRESLALAARAYKQRSQGHEMKNATRPRARFGIERFTESRKVHVNTQKEERTKASHCVLGEGFRGALVVGDVVVDVGADGFHWRPVRFHCGKEKEKSARSIIIKQLMLLR